MRSKKLFCLLLALTFIAAGFKKKTSEAVEAPPGQAEAKPNPEIDYVAKINELAKAGRDESLNAAPFYQKAIELCVEQPEELSTLDRHAWPADLSAKQQSQLREWVQSNSKALSQLELGTKKPYYWEKRSSKDGTVMSMFVPGLAEFRQLTFAIRWRAKLSAAEGNIDKAIADIVTCYRFGLHVSDEPVLIGQLVGIAIRAVALDTAFEVLDRTKVGQASMKSLQTEIEQLSTDESYIVDMRAEKFCMLDVIQRIFTDDGKGSGQIHMQSVESLSELVPISQDIWGDSVPFEELQRHQTTETVEELYEYADFVVRKTPWQWKSGKMNPKEEIIKIMKKNLVVHIFCPSFVRIAEIFARCRAHTNALITTLALLRYRANEGGLPEELNELVSAGYLKALANDPFSTRPFVYKRLRADFALYGFGEDCDDDGGEVVRDSKGKVKKWADAGDWVFWPVEPPQK